MTQHERLSTVFACDACGASLPRERFISLEIELLQKELGKALALIGAMKPMLITASYYLDQHAHLLHESLTSGNADAAQVSAREAHVRQISGELMDAYCRSAEILSLP